MTNIFTGVAQASCCLSGWCRPDMSVFKRGLEEYKSVSRCLRALFCIGGWGAIYRLISLVSWRSPPALTWRRLQQIVLSADVEEEAEPSQHEVGMTNLTRLI